MKRLFPILLAFGVYAAGPNEDPSIYVTALKEEEIDEKILESEVYEECKNKLASGADLTKEVKDEIRVCVSNKLANVDPEQLKEFASDINLDAVGFKETKNSNSLKEYLDKRIFNAIHGEDAYEKQQLKELKAVDQALFLDLYKTQISKNLIVEVSRYCLENVGIGDDPAAFIAAVEAADQASVDEANQTKKKSFDVAFSRMLKGEPAKISLRYQSVASIDPNDGSKWTEKTPTLGVVELNASDPGNFWSKLKEYKYCPNVIYGDSDEDKKDPCHHSKARGQAQIQMLKDQELKWAQADSDKIQRKYLSCSNFVIKNMCEIYRCNNVYEPNSLSALYKNQKASKVCPLLGASINPTRNTPQTDAEKAQALSLDNQGGNKGQIACNLLKRVETYKKTFAAIEDLEAKQEELKGAGTGVQVDKIFKAGVYDRNNVDDITSISSKELVEKVDGTTKKESEELEKKCFDPNGNFNSGNQECEALVQGPDGVSLDKITLDTEAETAAYLKRLEKLGEEDDKDEVKEYLIKHGLTEYLEMYENDEIDGAMAAKLIGDKYKADRQALINNMKERFYRLTQKNSGTAAADPAEITKVARDQIEEVKQHRDRLETLYNYSNIVSSYLEAKDEDGNTSKNTRARQVELEALRESDPDAAEEFEMYFSDNQEDSNSDATLSAQGQFIDDILGIGSSD